MNFQQPDEVSVHSDDSNVDNLSVISQPATPTSENGRIRPSRPAPAIPTGLSRSATRRSAPPPPTRTQLSNDTNSEQPQAAPRRSAPAVQRQASIEDNSAANVRKIYHMRVKFFHNSKCVKCLL